MNINLSASTTKKQGKGKSIGFGLNKRKKPSNVFEDDDDEDSDQEQGEERKKSSRRDAVNQEIAKEQVALRKRAMKAMSANAYDFDGSYDKLQAEKKKEEEAAKPPEEKKSRYIQDLLKQSEKRVIEREAVYERKVAREQEEEDAQADYRGKEKFVTKAYQRRLEERKKMAQEDAKQEKIDQAEDVTKRTKGAAMATFYGNFQKNVAVGGGDKPDEKDTSKKDALAAELGFMEGFERAGGKPNAGEKEERKEESTINKASSSNEKKEKKKVQLDPAAQNRAMRKAREEKLTKARNRYFERNGMPVQ